MGLEEKVTAKKGRKTFDGKLHVDSRQLEFRSKEFKWNVSLDGKPDAEASKGLLVVQNGSEKVSFKVSEPQKWVSKILNPPSLTKKLGVKSEQCCFISKGFDRAFKTEIRAAGAKIVRSIERAELLFLRIDSVEQLSSFDEVASELESGVNIWVIWPKGSKNIGQSDVMRRAKSLGLGPSKTASINDDHSSMRFAKTKK